ncbi:hypothetical protein LZ31DRAFT_261779 [Colletotrichum somersetense]|nr:hypothetical protein LZ31DRAFT_261779 [Colletotrichum somersetense]
MCTWHPAYPARQPPSTPCVCFEYTYFACHMPPATLSHDMQPGYRLAKNGRTVQSRPAQEQRQQRQQQHFRFRGPLIELDGNETVRTVGFGDEVGGEKLRGSTHHELAALFTNPKTTLSRSWCLCRALCLILGEAMQSRGRGSITAPGAVVKWAARGIRQRSLAKRRMRNRVMLSHLVCLIVEGGQ